MIRTSDKTLTFTDKTSNMYRLSKDQYNMLLNNSITSTYKSQITTSRTKSTSAGETF